MTTRKQIVNRLKRARGQLDSLIDHIESGDANCRDVLTQFAAVNSAIKRASYLALRRSCRSARSRSPASTTMMRRYPKRKNL